MSFGAPSQRQLASGQRYAAAPVDARTVGLSGYTGTPVNPRISYTRNSGVTSADLRPVLSSNVPLSTPGSQHGRVMDQTLLDTNQHLEDSESRFLRASARARALEGFVAVPIVPAAERSRSSRRGMPGISQEDQLIRRGQWQPAAVRYPSVNLVQRTIYGTSDPNWRHAFTPVDYAGLWDYQQEAAAWRRRHAAQLRYLRCHPAACAPPQVRVVRYSADRERPLGA